MGHSHAHHDHHHHQHHSNEAAMPMSESQKRNRMIQKAAIWLLCAVGTVGRKLIQHRVPSRSDAASLVVSLVLLSSFQSIQQAIAGRISTAKDLAMNIFRHSRVSGASGATLASLQNGAAEAARMRDTSEADRVTWIGVIVNLILSAGKLGVGMVAHSSALIADAGHSLSDLVSDFITLWSVQIARLPPDEDHPYGHYKFEAIGSLFLSLTLLATGVSVGSIATKQLHQLMMASRATTAAAAVQLPGPWALVMAGISIASKEWLFRITKRVGDKLQSPVVVANAWHHRSDAYSSVLALLSIAWAMTGVVAADAAAGLLVAGMICMTGGDIMIESVQQLSDSADQGLSQELQDVVANVQANDPDILSVTSVRARQVGSSALVDVSVEVSSDLTTTATRAVEERLKQQIVQEFAHRKGGGRIITATVHASPNLILCPLLEANAADTAAAMKNDHDHSHSHNHAIDDEDEGAPASSMAASSSILSASQMEFLVRQRALLQHPKDAQYKIQSVLVHYVSTQSVIVDITMASTSDFAGQPIAWQTLQQQAKDLQMNLESSIPEIQQVRIALDLLESPTNTQTGLAATALPETLLKTFTTTSATASKATDGLFSNNMNITNSSP